MFLQAKAVVRDTFGTIIYWFTRVTMRLRTLAVLLLLLCASVPAYGEKDYLDISVTDASTPPKPISGVVLTIRGDKTGSPPTDTAGNTRIKLAAAIQPNSEITLEVMQAPQGMIFISPWDRRVKVPAESATENTVVVMAAKGDRAILQNGELIKAVTEQLLVAMAQKIEGQKIADYQRQLIVSNIVTGLGQQLTDIDTAIKKLGQSQDLYDKGIAALYERDYLKAAQFLNDSLATREQNPNRSTRDIVEAAFFLGNALYEQGKYQQAVKAYQRAFDLRNDEHFILNALGIALFRAGKADEAELVLVKARAVTENYFSPQHPNVAMALNNLALLYEAQGKYEQAEPLYQRALAIVEKAAESERHNLVSTLINLSGFYYAQGKFDKAEPLYERLIQMQQQLLGKDHATLATGLNNLAALYESQGKFDKAEPLYVQALRIQEQALGRDHADVAALATSLAGLYRTLGQLDKAEPLYQRALTIREQALGKDHVDVATAQNNLAELYRTQGKLDKAEPLFERALAVREKALGKDHASLATLLNSLASLYKAQSKYDKAEPLYQRAFKIIVKRSGANNANAEKIFNHYAGMLKAMGREAEIAEIRARLVNEAK